MTGTGVYDALTAKHEVVDMDRYATRCRCKHDRKWSVSLTAVIMMICLAGSVVSVMSAVYTANAKAEVRAAEDRILEYEATFMAARPTSVKSSFGENLPSGQQMLRDIPIVGEDKDEGLVSGIVNDLAKEEADDEEEIDDFELEGDTEVLDSNPDYDYDSLLSDMDDYDVDDEEEDTKEEEEEEEKEKDIFSDDESFSVEGSGDMDEPRSRNRREAKESGRRPNKNKDGKPKRNNNGGSKAKREKMSLPVAQYDGSLHDKEVQNIIDQKFNSHENIEKCKKIESMGGVLCLNKTFIPSGGPLNIFQQASWNGAKASPLVKNPTNFVAKSSGVHLVFAQILFNGNDSVKAASVIQYQDNKALESLSCHAGAFNQQARQQTCTIIGFLNLKRRDVIKVVTFNEHASLRLSKGSTYFGVMQVTGWRGPKNKKRN